MSNSGSSEEKLLKLIRKAPGAKKKAIGGDGIEAQTNFTKPLIKENVAALRWVKWGNGILWFGCLVLIGLIGFQYFDLNRQPKRVFKDLVEENNKNLTTKAFQGEVKKWQYDTTKIKDIFEAPWNKKNVNIAVSTDLDQSARARFLEQFQFAGVILDSEPQAVFQNIKTKESVVVGKGEQILGARVDEVQEDKVILNWDGVVFEINP